MNRKGFAISTLIYGLSIMGILLMTILIGIMSVNRSNNRKLSDTIEEELTKFGVTELSFSPTNDSSMQQYTVPVGEAGWYRIELLGAAGKDGGGGYGAYTSGVIELNERDTLYFKVGKMTSTYGEATEVRVDSGNFNSRIMVAAGGGKNSGANGGTLSGYTLSSKATGGTLNIVNKSYKLITPTLVGFPSNPSEGVRTFNQNSIPTNTVGGEGGRGFYNGTDANSGGTSFIAGYAGCKGIDGNVLSSNPRIGVSNTEEDEEGIVSGGKRYYYFVDGLMVPGVNNGNGAAKIERVVQKKKKAQTLARKNPALNGVTKITDCVDAPGPYATKISAVAAGVDYTINQTPTVESTNCRSVTLTEAKNLDEIAVWHGFGNDYKNHTIKINNTTDVKKMGSGTNGLSETETSTGYRVSAYQYDSTKKIPDKGNYYLMPVLSENQVVTAKASSSDSSSPIEMEYFKGKKIQKWSIELITNKKVSDSPGTPEYKIIDLARFNALEIKDDENREKTAITASTPFNSIRRNPPQIWRITAVGNGTYTIDTAQPNTNENGLNTGFIYPQFAAGNTKNQVLIGLKNKEAERFRLISIDYSSGTNTN